MKLKSRNIMMAGASVAMALSVVASGTVMGQARTSVGTQPFVQAWPSWPPLGVVNPFSPNAINLYGWVNSPLAYYTQWNNSYVPEVAASWSMKAKPGSAANGVLTIHLRKGATWSDGSPITSKDVLDSLEIGMILNQQVDTYISSISTPNSQTVVIKQNSKPFNLFEQQILTSWIYSSKTWGSYIPKNVQHLFFTSLGTSKAAAAASTQLGNVAKKLASVDVKNYLSSGPFTVGQITSNQITMPKNDKWWGASKVHVPSYELLASSGNTQNFSYALGQRADYLTTYAPPTVVDPFLARPNDHIVGPDGNYGPGLYFNTSMKPFDDLRVRQAFAYIINRTQVEQIAYPVGTSSVKAATAAKYLTGLPTSNYKLLTKQTIKKLNPYNTNLKKAASLLESAGFKKVNGSWQYNGKPFKMDIACPGAYTDWVAIAENIATQLSQFGINSQARSVDVTTYFNKIPSGTYPLALNSIGSENLSPWYDYGMIVNNGEGLSINSEGKISRIKTSYNWGPVVNANGVGKVNVVDLWNQLVSTTNQNQLQSDVNKLALTVNQTLPEIDLLYNKFYAIFYNTNHYTGFPSVNNPLWDPNISANSAALMFIEQGYIKPAQ